MEYNGYTKLDNSILFDQEISAQAKILYMQFLNFSSIPNFVIRKATMIKASGLKGNTFEKYLKELKDHKLIKVHAVRSGKKYEYHYTVAGLLKSEKSESKYSIKSNVISVEERVVASTSCTVEEARQALVIANCNG